MPGFAVLDEVSCKHSDHGDHTLEHYWGELAALAGALSWAIATLIFLLVGIGNVIDVQVLGHPGVLRTAIIFFYLSNEGLSLTENAAHLGLPVPEKLKEVLEQLHDRHDEEEK